MSDNEINDTPTKKGVWMTLGGSDGSSDDAKVIRVDDDLPWVLDPQRLANWTDEALYDLEVSFREWLFKSMNNSSWKVPSGKGKWNIGSRMTFDRVRDQFNIGPKKSKNQMMLSKLCRHYAMKVRVTKGGIAVRGKKHSDTGFYFPRDPKKVKPPYNLKLRFEYLLTQDKPIITLRDIMLPRAAEKTSLELHQTRRLQNQKRNEYYKRWQEKYGGKYEYPKSGNSANENTDS